MTSQLSAPPPSLETGREERIVDVRSLVTERTLFVDLDGTLIRSDLLWESLCMTARQQPMRLLNVPAWLFKGKAELKAGLAESCEIDVATLPYRESVLDHLREARRAGRRIVLATGANEKFAREIADHLGLFDDVIASDASSNLTSGRKLEKITRICGAEGFDYVGNSQEDLCLFEQAEEAMVVAPDHAAAKWQRSRGSGLIPNDVRVPKQIIKTMRVHQWAKNLLVFVPIILAHGVLEPASLLAAFAAFLAFSFAASSVYIVNDLLDLSADRRHKTKCQRPLAKGTLPIVNGVQIAICLLTVALAISLILPAQFFAVIACYMVLTTAYSFALKRMLLIDVIVLAGLYTVRVLAGAEATGAAASFWLLAFSLFFFLSLAMVKRYTELLNFGTGADRAKTGRGYVDADLETLSQAGMASGFASVMVLALYIDSSEVRAEYSEPFLVWPLCIVMLYVIVRIWILARRGQMYDDPVVFLLTDWRSQIIIAAGAALFLIASSV